MKKKPNPGNQHKTASLKLNRDLFTEVVQSVKYSGLQEINSHFSDDQAVSLCSKMSSSYARRIVNELSQVSDDDERIERLYQIHFMANKAHAVFGGKILTLLYELPKLEFKYQTAIEVKTYTQVRPDFPLITFQVNQTKLNVTFYTKLHRNIIGGYTPNVSIYTSGSHHQIGWIDETGHIQVRLEKFRPQLSIFIGGIQDGRFEYYSGVETGRCEICTRPLTHPLSLRIGIGPECAKKIGLDRSYYDEL